MPENESATGPTFGFMTLDFIFRVILPGALIFFVLGLAKPEYLERINSYTIAGLFAFLLLGFLSYSLYRALYVGLISRWDFVSPQMTTAKTEMKSLTKQEKPWPLVRAIYISWRETQSADPRLKYAARSSPYVHAGYQSAIIFGFFALYGLTTSLDPFVASVFAIVSVILFLISLYQDHELGLVEKDYIVANWGSFYSYLVKAVAPGGKGTVPDPPPVG